MKGHIIAFVTVAVWGVTYVSTKVLLQAFLPIEILLLRFVMGLVALCIMSPHILRLKERKHELYFIAAGATGAFLYYLLENVALVYGSAGNIGVTVSVAPLFTAVVATAIGREKALTPCFIIGFVIALAGIALTGGQDEGSSNPLLGNLLGLGAAFTWALYSNILAKINELGYETIPTTKRTFVWGVLFMLIVSPFFGASAAHLPALLDPVILGNLAFLGFGASAGCFVTWGLAVRYLGASSASVYIYLSPAITVVTGAFVLGEPLTPLVILGIVLVVGGLVVSQIKTK